MSNFKATGRRKIIKLLMKSFGSKVVEGKNIAVLRQGVGFFRRKCDEVWKNLLSLAS